MKNKKSVIVLISVIVIFVIIGIVTVNIVTDNDKLSSSEKKWINSAKDRNGIVKRKDSKYSSKK